MGLELPAGRARPPRPTRRLRLPLRPGPSAPPLGPPGPLLRPRHLLPGAAASKVPHAEELVSAPTA